MVQPSTSAVLAEVGNERIRQDAIWGGPEHDDEHDLTTWHILINNHTRAALAADFGFEPDGDVRKELIQVAALAVAAVESLDRKAAPTAEGGRE